MPKRRAEAGHRRFTDEFPSVRVSRLRAMGVIDPARHQAAIPFPSGRIKLITIKHTRFPNGGGWSFFVCPSCARRTNKLYLIYDKPLCGRCCAKLNIAHRSKYGFGRQERMRAPTSTLSSS
jgi:hypothetical protein